MGHGAVEIFRVKAGGEFTEIDSLYSFNSSEEELLTV
jgi:hypothetical protein